ncbi:hypothetical protein bsdcttw_00440 [Anaerocolumna chitinilytica]|uniref:Uncharacterized protein n=1 Tax=Anaerocolumna chitinilytica TaxID=1727145 RepID=A0A7I8DEP0_9FIRM|nr:hypothetical protein bsdcttw_00440 [Anaerocolumna chitinilytica]
MSLYIGAISLKYKAISLKDKAISLKYKAISLKDKAINLQVALRIKIEALRTYLKEEMTANIAND